MFHKKSSSPPSTKEWWIYWTMRLFLVMGGLGIILVLFNAVVNFHASTMTSPPPLGYTDIPPEGDTFSAVTLNTWRLCDVARVPAMLQALRIIGHTLHPETSDPRLPDIMLLQELECQASQEHLQAALEETHWFAANVCARKRSGTPRSTVGLAVNRAKFDILGTIALDLGRIIPDHGRCALGVALRSRTSTNTLQIITVHHSPHPLKYRQTQELVKQCETHRLFEADGVLLGGDFNFSSHARSYRLLTSYLTDPLPKNRGRTHWTGGRIDFVFINDRLTLVQPLDRKIAYETLRPAGLFRSIYRCSDPEWGDCPLSDHLPEGGLFAFQAAYALTDTHRE